MRTGVGLVVLTAVPQRLQVHLAPRRHRRNERTRAWRLCGGQSPACLGLAPPPLWTMSHGWWPVPRPLPTPALQSHACRSWGDHTQHRRTPPRDGLSPQTITGTEGVPCHGHDNLLGSLRAAIVQCAAVGTERDEQGLECPVLPVD